VAPPPGCAGRYIGEPVLPSLPHWGWWAPGRNGIFFLEAGREHPAKVHLKFLGLDSKRITDLRTLEFPVSFDGPLTVSPDGRKVLFEQIENLGSKIVMIENFR